MAGRLAGKVAVITGAAGGLGRVAAELFAHEGAKVVVADVADGSEAVDSIRSTGGVARYLHCDVTSDESVGAAIADTVSSFGGCTCSTTTPASPRPTTTEPTEHADADMGARARGQRQGRLARCCKHGIPAMLDVGRRFDRERRVVRRAHGRGDAADRVHLVEGRRARDDRARSR